MSPLIHGCVGWLLGQPLEKKRDRVVVTLAAVLPDLDGIGLLISEDLYVAWHHRLAHGFLFALATWLTAALVCRSLRAAFLALLAFHSHVLMDLAGSGPGWPILYLWPFWDTEWLPSWQWDLASWQNSLFGFAILLLCLAMGVWKGRTPVELFSARADAAVVRALRQRFG